MDTEKQNGHNKPKFCQKKFEGDDRMRTRDGANENPGEKYANRKEDGLTPKIFRHKGTMELKCGQPQHQAKK